jgi:O-antigen/teichoic acid export membrane protein
VLDPQEKSVFDRLVTQLGADDPDFAQRMEKIAQRRRVTRTTLAVMLWVFAPISLVVGGWTGALMAALAVGYGVYLYRTREIPGRPPRPSSV